MTRLTHLAITLEKLDVRASQLGIVSLIDNIDRAKIEFISSKNVLYC